MRQKAINLNRNVFIDELYPGLPDATSETESPLTLSLFIYGPGLEGEYTLSRKITVGGRPPSRKNWRLDGAYVPNPPEAPDRFNRLVVGDYAVIEFFGDTRPESARVVFLGSEVSEDVSLHGVFEDAFGTGPGMVSLTPVQLAQLVEAASPSSDHPILDFVSAESTLEIAALGDRQETTKLKSTPSPRKMSRTVLQKARSNADRLGQLGEEFVNSHLASLEADGSIKSFEWTSRENAIAPYDFQVDLESEQIVLDVKTTESGFEKGFHVSLGELRRMGYGAERYDLYRVFELTETTAKLRVSRNLRDWAREIIEVLVGLPEGIRADGITVSPSSLTFDDVIEIEIPDEEIPDEPEQMQFEQQP